MPHHLILLRTERLNQGSARGMKPHIGVWWPQGRNGLDTLSLQGRLQLRPHPTAPRPNPGCGFWSRHCWAPEQGLGTLVSLTSVRAEQASTHGSPASQHGASPQGQPPGSCWLLSPLTWVRRGHQETVKDMGTWRRRRTPRSAALGPGWMHSPSSARPLEPQPAGSPGRGPSWGPL